MAASPLTETPGPTLVGASGRGLLVIDDDPSMHDLIEAWLPGEPLRFAEDAASGWAAFRHLPEVVLLDLSLPDEDGLDLLPRLLRRSPELPVVILTAKDDASTVVEAMRRGAYDYLTKPLDRRRLQEAVQRARHRARLVDPAVATRDPHGPAAPRMIGRSAAMAELFRQLERLAPQDVSVLVHGESGTGKELVARALHEEGHRADGPLVTLNCAAIPEGLQEAELFGHEKGAFTGADGRRVGRFEEADGGTLFLDEVAELSPGLQAKLLRVLQERTFRRIGGDQVLRSDFRLVAASHKRIADEVAAGRFRSDLYYRLAVMELEVPPLRARDDDVVLLAEQFLRELSPAGGPPLELGAEVMERLLHYAWPGNVRELRNALHRASILCSGGRIATGDLPPSVAAAPAAEAVAAEAPAAPSVGPAGVEAEDRTLAGIERRAILDAIERHGGNVAAAGRELAIGRTTLYRKLKQYGVQR